MKNQCVTPPIRLPSDDVSSLHTQDPSLTDPGLRSVESMNGVTMVVISTMLVLSTSSVKVGDILPVLTSSDSIPTTPYSRLHFLRTE